MVRRFPLRHRDERDVVNHVEDSAEQQENNRQAQIRGESDKQIGQTYATSPQQEERARAGTIHELRGNQRTHDGTGANRRLDEAVGTRPAIERTIRHHDKNRGGHPEEDRDHQCQRHR